MYKILSTFTGGGGLDIGFHGDFSFLGQDFARLKFSTVTALDINKDACQTLTMDLKYFNDTEVYNEDIINFDETQIKDKGYDVLLGGFPCFTAGTKISTDYGFSDIEKLKVGDKVLTHTGLYQPITLRMENQAREIYRIGHTDSYSIECTGNHPFYCSKEDGGDLKWIEAKDLTEDHYVTFCHNSAKIILPAEYMVLAASFLYGGWVMTTPSDKIGEFTDVIHLRASLPVLDSLKSLKVKFTELDNSVSFSDKEIGKFLINFNFKKSYKAINSTTLSLKKESLKLLADEYIRIVDHNNKVWPITIGKEEEALSLQAIFLRAYGNRVSIEKETRKDKGNVETLFKLSKPISQELSDNNIVYTKIHSIDVIEKNVKVYNIEVNEDNSYVANNTIVHNCVTFSVVGKQKGIKDDINGKLYESYARYVETFRPKVFLAENVKGILSANKGQAIKIIKKRFEETGYKIKVYLVNFADFGVPQLRERVLFIGVRDDIKTEFIGPEFTTKNNRITSQEAFVNISDDLPNMYKIKALPKTTERIAAIPEGGNFKDLPKELAIKGLMSNIYRRLDRNKPSYTVIASGGGGTWHYHYEEPRALTNRERARIQSFPDDLVFQGTNTEARRQVGNAVPPVGIHSFAMRIQDVLDGIDNTETDECIKEV
jgi:DNA (cytosine-5)-methyltransferase 1